MEIIIQAFLYIIAMVPLVFKLWRTSWILAGWAIFCQFAEADGAELFWLFLFEVFVLLIWFMSLPLLLEEWIPRGFALIASWLDPKPARKDRRNGEQRGESQTRKDPKTLTEKSKPIATTLQEKRIAERSFSVYTESVTIYTLGYGNRPRLELLELLQRYEINCVVDVRSKPYSRVPDYNRASLESWLKAESIEYRFAGEYLGGQPDDPELKDAEGHILYDAIRSTDRFQRGIAALRKIQKTRRMALFCSELRPETCHRTKLIAESMPDVSWKHVDEAGNLQDQQSIMQRITGGQTDMFGHSLKSRGKY